MKPCLVLSARVIRARRHLVGRYVGCYYSMVRDRRVWLDRSSPLTIFFIPSTLRSSLVVEQSAVNPPRRIVGANPTYKASQAMPPMFTVYVLKSLSTGKFYTGHTENLSKRLDEHCLGLARYTRNRGPWELVYTEEHETRSKTIRWKRYLKSGSEMEHFMCKSTISQCGCMVSSTPVW